MPAEQGQERWTIRAIRSESVVNSPFVVSGPAIPEGEEVEVVPAAELEMCQRYFPFMRRSRDEAVKREKATREWANQRTREEADHADRQTKKLQEAQEREKALREALENALAADTESETRHIIYVALDQSGKGARR